MVTLLISDARIDDGVQDVGQQLAEQRQDAEHERQAHDRVVVALADGFEEQPAHAGPAENLLEDDGAAQQAAAA